VLSTPAYAANEGTKPFATVSQPEPGDVYASDLIGTRVYATEKDVAADSKKADAETDWDDIGEIDDVVLTEDGDVKAVILGVGGFLGIGERDIAVKMSSLNMVREDDGDDFFIVVKTSKDNLMGAPAYTRETVEPEKASKAEEPKMAAKEATDRDAKSTRPAIKRDDYRVATARELTAEMLEGAPVYGSDDEEVGEVDRLLLNDDGKPNGVVVDVGGLLGLGEHPVAFEIDELQILSKDDGDDVVVFVDSTKSALKSKPKYKG